MMRVGIGYDVHRFGAKANTLTLGGVRIPYTRGLRGHSDADVLLHAITDAMLGAVGSPDLGTLFPSSDPAYRHADSRRFIQRAKRLVRAAGWQVRNIDATVVADGPRLTKHRVKMQQAIGRMLDVRPAVVSVKAKTTEGFPPGKQGIAAQAVVLLHRPRRLCSATPSKARSPTLARGAPRKTTSKTNTSGARS